MNATQGALIAGAIITATIGGVVALSGTEDPEASLNVGSAAPAPVDAIIAAQPIDAASSQPGVTDMLSPPVAPGASITTGVTLPAGYTATGIALTGSAVGQFDVTAVDESATPDGTGTWMTVTAHNGGQGTLRFSAAITFGPAQVGSAVVSP